MAIYITHKYGDLYRVKLMNAVDAPRKNYTKSQIIEMTNKGDHFVIEKTGIDVHVVNGKWLRTDPNDIKEDNLGELPEIPEGAIQLFRKLKSSGSPYQM